MCPVANRDARHERLLFVFVVVLCASLGALAGCDTNSCVGRGKQTSYTGATTYSIHFDGGQVTAGRENASVYAFDYDADCVYDNEEYVISIDGCRVWVQYDASNSSSSSDDSSSDDDDNSPVVASSTIESGQTCTMNLAAGDATLAITGGNMLIGTDYDVVSVDATLTAWNSAPSSGGLHLDFTGQ